MNFLQLIVSTCQSHSSLAFLATASIAADLPEPLSPDSKIGEDEGGDNRDSHNFRLLSKKMLLW